MFKLLIDHGPCENAELRPPAVAAKHGHAYIVLFLLGRGVAINVDQIGNLALTIAARSSHEPLVQLLVERGVPVNRNVIKYPHQLLMR